jgi:hypothetical protein
VIVEMTRKAHALLVALLRSYSRSKNQLMQVF